MLLIPNDGGAPRYSWILAHPTHYGVVEEVLCTDQNKHGAPQDRRKQWRKEEAP